MTKMTEKKPNPNPFIRMAQEAKERKQAAFPGTNGNHYNNPKAKAPRAPSGPVNKVMRKTGRGG